MEPKPDSEKKASKCPVCGAYNAPGRVYCADCLSYLPDARKTEEIPSLFEEEMENQPKAARCPRCGALSPAPGGVLPPLCGQCGYFFQMDIDCLISLAEPLARTYDALRDDSDAFNPFETLPRKTSPMPSVGASDKTVLRLVSASAHAPLTIAATGTEISGARERVRISRAVTGWYLHALSGEVRVNAQSVSAGQTYRISDGDFITLCGGVWKAEILTKRENAYVS